MHDNPSLPVILESDTRQYGIRAVILHCFPNGEYRPIAYSSRSFDSAKKDYSQIEKEGLAIIFGMTKYYMYLSGRKFTLRTGHKPLLKMTLPHSFWQQHAFSIGPYSSHHTSVKLNSSLLLKWPPPMPCPDYHRHIKREDASIKAKSSRCQWCK